MVQIPVQGPVAQKSRNFSGDIILFKTKVFRDMKQLWTVILIFIPFTTYEKISFTE